MGDVETQQVDHVVAIHQPNFLPWVGYFDKISRVDTFVLFDDVQLPQGKSFCSRVKIKGANGPQWLTVPVAKKSKALINEVEIVQNGWSRKHIKTVESLYRKAPHFEKFWPTIRNELAKDWQFLADMNCALIETVTRLCELNTEFVRSSSFGLGEVSADQRILAILKMTGAGIYVSGEGAGSKRYIQNQEMETNGIKLVWQNFEHPVYQQLAKPFELNMSMLDMLFLTGGNVSREPLAQQSVTNRPARSQLVPE
jgi:hypothetical protein